ncbi:lactonase family protein [Streptomyces sp. MK37H]|uniref:lactonase family protein n=1 Tax=Streptomyces sp. MK37H TaxID=2699117 RepID=UPI001B36FFFD|nr:lactonase family protein [Streptomyces sp. MK37H]MBP8538617.1 beta-propeller fold lactonase family protein [Streptomyces sp. MK37H]
MGVTGSGWRAYIGSFTSAGGAGVTVADVDDETGALRIRNSTDVVVNPSYLVVAPGGRVLYAVSETDDGAAAALDVGQDPPSLIGEAVPVLGAAPTHLALAGGQLLTANYGSGSVTALPVLEDGRLGEAVAVLRHEGSGPHPVRQQGPHAHAVAADPSGGWLLAVDLGIDSVQVYALPGPRPHCEVRLRPGSGPRHLAFHPRGDRAYVINELDPTITACRWDAESGVLEPLGETRLVPEGTDVETYPAEVVVSGDGRFVWATNRGHDSIATLALDASGDRMELATTTPCGGHWPRDLTLGPSGRRLYVSNERSGDVTWFDIDPSSGVPRRGGSVPAPAASCVVFG